MLKKSKLFVFLAFLISFLTLTRFNLDPDLWWHMAMGRELLDNGRILRVDEFSWTMAGYDWGNSYFLYQIFVTFLFKNFGHIFLSFVFGLLASAGILILIKKLDLIKLFLVGISTFAASATLGIRPHTISFLFFSILLVLVEKKQYLKIRFLPLWFLFFAFWANFHRGFLVGIVLIFSFVIFDYLTAKNKVNLKVGLMCFAVSVAGTFVTPFPLKLWHSAVILDLSNKSNLSTIAEWLPIAVYPLASVLFVITGIVFIYIFYKNAKLNNLGWFLTGGALFMFSFVVTTFVFYWIAIFIFLVSRFLDIKIPEKFKKLSLILLLLMTGYLLWGFVREFSNSKDLNTRARLDGYPVEAVNKLSFGELTSGLYNDYVWGGFIDYWFGGAKVFIDGRMASWRFSDGSSILDDYINLASGACESLAKYDLKVVLVKPDFKSKCFEGWRIQYEDEIAKILQNN